LSRETSSGDEPLASESPEAWQVRQHAQEIMKSLRDAHLPFFLETERFT